MPKINLHQQLDGILSHNKDGSYSTQAARADILHMVANDLHQAGFYNLSTKGLKPKHIQAVINKWQSEGKSAGTLKNRMSHLRWLAAKIAKPAIVARTNSHYGIERRQYVTNVSKAKTLPADRLAAVADPHLKASLTLQQEFGLRREECMKFQPEYALNHDKAGFIRLKDSWCKGGRERYVPIRTEAQRAALEQAKGVAAGGSLIPGDRRYVDQMRAYEGECKRQGWSKLHGLRHAYAQVRFETLAGFKAPADGGPVLKELTQEQREIDREARQQISRELGHERLQIVAVYLGR